MDNTLRFSGPSVRRATRCALVIAVAFGVAACGGGRDDPASRQSAASRPSPAAQQSPPAPRQPAAQPAGGGAVGGRQAILAGVAFTPPATWNDLGPNAMRQAQYRLPPIGGDKADGEVNVFYFGVESGGGVDANLQRWIGQMVMPDGGDPASSARRSSFTADGMPGHIVALDGGYKQGGGGPMGGSGTLMPGYRLVGVVLEGPQGSLFFKLTGPAATARAMESELLTMVQGARKAG